jgi:hypothetical protein
MLRWIYWFFECSTYFGGKNSGFAICNKTTIVSSKNNPLDGSIELLSKHFSAEANEARCSSLFVIV